MEMLALAAAGYLLLSHSSTSSDGVNPAGVRTLGGPTPAPAGHAGAPAPSPAVAANGGVSSEVQMAAAAGRDVLDVLKSGFSLFDTARATGTQAPDTADVAYGVPGDPSNLVQVSATSPSPWGSFGYTPQSIFPANGPDGVGTGAFNTLA